METFPEYFRSEVPTGQSGVWVVEKVLVPEREGYDPTTDPRPDCFKFRPGLYTSLRCGSTEFMTDLYDEWYTQRAGISEALRRGGEILITGLGLGLVTEAILRPTESPVTRITIVELSSDVIRLVAPYLQDRYPGRVEVVEGDAFSWEPQADHRFTVGWHDIWPNPYAPECAEEMKRLEEHYSRWCDWQGFWPATYLEAAVAK